MNRTALVASLALAFASTAFAQDPQAASSSPMSDQASSTSSDAMNDASATDQSMQSGQPAADAQPMKPTHRMRHRTMHGQGRAAAAMNGDDPKEAQYQASNRMKSYPSVDHGHVAGDPPVIDHSGDQAPVANPTHTTIAVPPNHG